MYSAPTPPVEAQKTQAPAKPEAEANEPTASPSESPSQGLVCATCGMPIPSWDWFCSSCGTPVDEAQRPRPKRARVHCEEEEDLPMKWCSFLVYGFLPFGIFANLVTALMNFAASFFWESGKELYLRYPELKTLDFALTFLSFGFVILTVITRRSLKKRKRSGPILLILLFLLTALSNTAYTVLSARILDEPLLDLSAAFSFDSYGSAIIALGYVRNWISVSVNVAFATISGSYFYKRRHLFDE